MNPTPRLARLGGLIGLVLSIAACATIHPLSGPMAVVRDPAPCAARPASLLVLLPGSYSTPDEFIREGFVKAVRDRHLAIDVWLADASLGYYSDRTILDRLQADVIEPALRQGYRRIVLAGISVGGFGAIYYAESHPGQLATVIAIAPYLGSTMATHVIEASGGLARWRTLEGPRPIDDDDRLWRWLKTYTVADANPPPLYLAYGRSDRFARSDRVLAAALPADHSFSIEGDHDWPTWRPLWNQLLDGGALGVPTCAPSTSSTTSTTSSLQPTQVRFLPVRLASYSAWSDRSSASSMRSPSR